MENREGAEQPADFVAALLACTSLLTQVLDHMCRYPDSAPDAQPPPVVLANLLEEILGPVLDDSAALDRATATLEQAAATIERELYRVEPPPRNRAARRRRQPPSCR